MSEGDRATFCNAWLERLITAAVESGAKIPPKRKATAPPQADLSALVADNSPPAKKSKPNVILLLQVPSDNLPSAPTSVPSTSNITSGSSSLALQIPHGVIGNPKQQKLAAFGWQKTTPEEIQKHWAREAEAGAEKREAKQRADEKAAEKRKERERDLARLRKQRERERKRAAQPQTPSATNNTTVALMNSATAIAQGTSIGDVADVSCPYTQEWRKGRNGTQGGAKQGASKKVFWFHPFLFTLIEAAVRRNGWSAAHAVADLQHSHPQLFAAPGSTLHRATLWKWIVPNEKRFTDAALKNVINRRSLGGQGHTGVLAAHPDIVEKIVMTLKGLRTAGCAVNVPIARSLMLAIIKENEPSLLTQFSCFRALCPYLLREPA
ncbi:hypothetical protein B0H14DRAFT_3565785 [Mycena olivaceomarginata]|nr:hypothetical protein B0H14DRAFT_3565785 [Mycena olivaceomarginata]